MDSIKREAEESKIEVLIPTIEQGCLGRKIWIPWRVIWNVS